MSSPEEVRTMSPFPEYGITEHETLLLERFEGRTDELSSAMTPDEAQQKLENLGYDTTRWERVVREKIGSHDLRTFAIIALGNSPRLQYVIYANLRAIDQFEGATLRNTSGIGPVLNDSTMHTEALRQAMAS